MTTTYLANPSIEIRSEDLSDQCKSVVLTKTTEALESTAFGSTSRTYVGGLNNHQCVATFLINYDTNGPWDVLSAAVGTTSTVEIVADTKTFTLADAYCESVDVVNANLGELSEVQVTFTGGTLTVA